MPGKRRFEPKDWSCGDIIASDDLDRIEKGIQDIDNMIIISSQNPFSTHPESALWFNSAAEEIQVPTYDDFIDLQNDMQPVKDKMKDVVIVSKTNPLEQHPTNVLWFDPTSTSIEIPTYEEFEQLKSTLDNINIQNSSLIWEQGSWDKDKWEPIHDLYHIRSKELNAIYLKSIEFYTPAHLFFYVECKLKDKTVITLNNESPSSISNRKIELPSNAEKIVILVCSDPLGLIEPEVGAEITTYFVSKADERLQDILNEDKIIGSHLIINENNFEQYSNIDDLTANQIYFISSTINEDEVENLPEYNVNGTLIYYSYNTSGMSGVQLYTNYHNSYIRVFSDGNWSDWQKICYATELENLKETVDQHTDILSTYSDLTAAVNQNSTHISTNSNDIANIKSALPGITNNTNEINSLKEQTQNNTSQINNIHNKIEQSLSTLESIPSIDYIWEQGTVNTNTGAVSDSNKYIRTTEIPLNVIHRISLRSTEPLRFYIIYKLSDNTIASVSSDILLTRYDYEFPNNALSARIVACYIKNDEDVLPDINLEVSNNITIMYYNIQNNLYDFRPKNLMASFKRFAVFSDSFGAGVIYQNDSSGGITNKSISWPVMLARSLNTTVFNHSMSGQEAYSFLMGQQPPYNGKPEKNCGDNCINVACDGNHDVPLIIIQFDANNKAGLQLGNLDDIDINVLENCGNTIYGTQGKLLLKISEYYKDRSPVYIAIIIYGMNPIANEQKILTWRNKWLKIIEKVQPKIQSDGNYIFPINLYDEKPWENKTPIFYQAVSHNHWTAIGYNAFSELIGNRIGEYMLEHPLDFKDIEFIPSNEYITEYTQPSNYT